MSPKDGAQTSVRHLNNSQMSVQAVSSFSEKGLLCQKLHKLTKGTWVMTSVNQCLEGKYTQWLPRKASHFCDPEGAVLGKRRL